MVPISEESLKALPPPSTHALIRTHPDNGRKFLYLNPVRMESIVGLEDAEALALIAYTMAHATQQKYEYRHKWRPGDMVIWESHTILRYLAAVHGPTLSGATPAERTMVERWMDWLLGALNTSYVAVFKDAKKAPAERAPDFAAQSADLLAQLKILDGHIAGRNWFALDRFTIADMALGTIVKRCLEFPIERPPYSELTRWQAAIDARPGFAVAIGAKPSVLTPAA